MAKGLTVRQQEVLDFILKYVEIEGYPPSIREIGSEFAIGSLRGVTVHLDALERKGYIARSNTPRSIKLTHPRFQPSGNRVSMVPLLGTIAAGIPTMAMQETDTFVPIPAEMVRSVDDPFLLRIKGDSMIGDGIMPRDLVLIRPQKNFLANDIMAILVGEEATVKRVKRTPSTLQLMSSNPAYDLLEVSLEDTSVIGKVIGLLRDYEGRSF